MILAVAPTSESPLPRELDESTLRRAQNGDAAALHRFVKIYQGRVHAVIARTIPRRPDLVEDLAQDSFIKALRALPRFEVGGAARLSTWVITIAVRTALDAQKKAKRPPLTVVPQAPVGPAQHVSAAELHRQVEDFLQTLEPSTRAVLVLRFFHELELQEIAEALDLELGTVKSRLARARKRLAKQLEAS